MTAVLADTSIWIEYLRHGAEGPGGRLGDLLDGEEVVTCGPVVDELIAGARSEDRSALWRSLRALPWAALDRDAWYAVGVAAGKLRATGATTALTDVEIGVAASRARASVWTTDADFERLAAVVEGLTVLSLDATP